MSDDDVLEGNGPDVITLAQKNGNETAETAGSKILKNPINKVTVIMLVYDDEHGAEAAIDADEY